MGFPDRLILRDDQWERMSAYIIGDERTRGSVSALLAARDGLRVVLVDPDRARPRLEGMSPRLRQWLQGQGLLEGFPAPAGLQPGRNPGTTPKIGA